jgi:3,2-trans-enoyl-CoA isomerase
MENHEISILKDNMIKSYIILFAWLFCIVLQGHSPAGGCLLALCCEYRVMVGPKYTIGLNEAQLGIVAPKW